LRLEDVRLGVEKEDARPAVIAQDVGVLKFDGFKIPTPGAAPPLVLNSVADLELRDTPLDVVAAHCTDLKVNAIPFSIVASVVNEGRAGVAKIDVGLADQHASQWVWLGANEKREIVFAGLKSPAPGKYEVRCGDLVKEWMAP